MGARQRIGLTSCLCTLSSPWKKGIGNTAELFGDFSAISHMVPRCLNSSV